MSSRFARLHAYPSSNASKYPRPGLNHTLKTFPLCAQRHSQARKTLSHALAQLQSFSESRGITLAILAAGTHEPAWAREARFRTDLSILHHSVMPPESNTQKSHTVVTSLREVDAGYKFYRHTEVTPPPYSHCSCGVATRSGMCVVMMCD